VQPGRVVVQTQPVYQQPVYQAQPVYQQPVYQQPMCGQCIQGAGEAVTTADLEDLLDHIIAYRRKGTVGTANYTSRASTVGITNLRTGDAANTQGFLTPGELAVPVGHFIASEFLPSIDPPITKASYLYQPLRDACYAAVSNLITVRSDVFCAYVTVQAVQGEGTPDEKVVVQRRYVAILNRGDSNVVVLDSEPGSATADGNTVQDGSGKTWTDDRWKGRFVRMLPTQELRRIVGNDSDTLTVSPNWTTGAAEYEIVYPRVDVPVFTEVY